MPAKHKTCTTCKAPYERIPVDLANGSTRTVTGCPRHWRQGECNEPASGPVPGAAPATGQAAKPAPAKPAKKEAK